MIEKARARAFANIALTKYWGKSARGSNVPATPSVSLCLDRLITNTEIARKLDGSDEVQLQGEPATGQARDRVIRLLNEWRKDGLLRGSFIVSSANDFPTAAGLASSASGFAALVTALSAFSEVPLSREELSRLARRGSGSAARSVTGGISALPVGDNPASEQLQEASDVEWGMAVAVVESPAKETGSTEGMRLSETSSPYYHSWVERGKEDFEEIKLAIHRRDFTKTGEITEANALAMHACMIATRPSLLYWRAATVSLLHEVRNWRRQGVEAYATIDAGPHVAFLTPLSSLEKVADLASEVVGVRMCLPCLPAGPSEIIG